MTDFQKLKTKTKNNPISNRSAGFCENNGIDEFRDFLQAGI